MRYFSGWSGARFNIRKYKNRLRPIIKQEHRAEILVCHKSVDFEFIIDEVNEPNEAYYSNLYKCLHPQTVTIGRNFSDTKVKKRKLKEKFVRELDAEVSSTTRIISSIVNKHKIG